MIKKLSSIKYLLIPFLILSVTSCQRSKDEFWEDAKTAQHHMGRGFRSLFGQSPEDSREITSYQEFQGPSDYDFIPLNEADLQQGGATAAIPQSKESPGEPSSTIPSIDGFQTPSTASEQELFSNLHFRYNDYSIDNSDNVAVAKRIAEYMKSHPNLYVFIEGHCDQRGTAAYNLSLGSRRSNAVRTFLIKEGVNLDNLFTISYGKEKPIDPKNTEDAWAKNRRAQFKLFYR